MNEPSDESRDRFRRLRWRYIVLAVELAQLQRDLRNAAQLLAGWHKQKNGRSA